MRAMWIALVMASSIANAERAQQEPLHGSAYMPSPPPCTSPFELFPPNGAINVPLNAVAWFSNEGQQPAHWWLRQGSTERDLFPTHHPTLDIFVVELGRLNPNTTYSVLRGVDLITTFRTESQSVSHAPNPPRVTAKAVIGPDGIGYFELAFTPDPDLKLAELEIAGRHFVVGDGKVAASCFGVTLASGERHTMSLRTIDAAGQASEPTRIEARVERVQPPPRPPKEDDKARPIVISGAIAFFVIMSIVVMRNIRRRRRAPLA